MRPADLLHRKHHRLSPHRVSHAKAKRSGQMMFLPQARRKADTPNPSLSEARIPDTGSGENCSREGRLPLPSIPEDHKGGWRRNTRASAVLGRHASMHPCALDFQDCSHPELAGAGLKLAWAADPLASVLNPEPATHEGYPLSSSQNEDRRAKKGLFCHCSPMDPPRARLQGLA